MVFAQRVLFVLAAMPVITNSRAAALKQAELSQSVNPVIQLAIRSFIHLILSCFR